MIRSKNSKQTRPVKITMSKMKIVTRRSKMRLRVKLIRRKQVKKVIIRVVTTNRKRIKVIKIANRR